MTARKPRPNDYDWMKSKVDFCIYYIALFHVAAFVALFFGVDASTLVIATDAAFSIELLNTLIIKINERNNITKRQEGE